MPISVSNRYINSPITPPPGVLNTGYVEAYVPNNQTASNGKSYAGGTSGQVPIPHPAVAQGSLGAPNILLSPAPGSI